MVECDLKPLVKNLDADEAAKVSQCYEFARHNLWKVKRRSGENYFEHGYQVAKTTLEVSADPVMIAVLLLHDLQVLADGDQLLESAPLDKQEKELVRQMNNLRQLHISKNSEELDKVVDAFARDPYLLVMRMAHRLTDVRNLENFTEEMQQKIASETMHMYTAIAGRLGFNAWQHEMEDQCFRKLYPEVASELQQQIDHYRPMDESCLKHTKDYLADKLKQTGINVEIEERIKCLYSSYRKMSLKSRTLRELTDRLALRVIVESLEECYLALGVIHTAMHPVPGKLKDYIGAPKENGYRSIHTVVFPLPGVTDQAVEIQIRTKQMHFESQYGVAAHNKYKESAYALTCKPARVNLFRNLEVLKNEARTPEQFETLLRTYFDEDKLIVFDSENNLYHLTKPARAEDFLNLVQREKSTELQGVRINGLKKSIMTPLHDGDVVEILE